MFHDTHQSSFTFVEYIQRKESIKEPLCDMRLLVHDVAPGRSEQRAVREVEGVSEREFLREEREDVARSAAMSLSKMAGSGVSPRYLGKK